jgi:hypothetical protein
MQSKWRFDSNNPYEDSFEQALLKAGDSPYVFDMVRRKCHEIQKNPTGNYRGLVKGKFVYIAKTGRVQHGDIEIEPLLIVYTLQKRDELIQRVFVCRAGEVADEHATMEQIARALRTAVERAIENAKKH